MTTIIDAKISTLAEILELLGYKREMRETPKGSRKMNFLTSPDGEPLGFFTLDMAWDLVRTHSDRVINIPAKDNMGAFQ